MEMEIVFPNEMAVDARYQVMVQGSNGMPELSEAVIPTNQDGSAPTPFALFLASMGTCAGIYVLGFCRQRGLPTEGIRIIQRMQTNPITRIIEEVELDIQVPSSFPQKYHSALIRSASQCAVKKHLEQPPEFNVHTSVVETA